MADYFVLFRLPPAVVVSPVVVFPIYMAALLMDYLIISYIRLHRSSAVSSTGFFIIVIAYHILIPLSIVSTSPGLNVFFTAAPLYMAMFTASLPPNELASIRRWGYRLSTDLVDPDQGGRVRLHGLAKVFRGLFKLIFNQAIVNPYGLGDMNNDLKQILTQPWYEPQAVLYHLVLGIKAYCLLGIVDMWLGAEQALFGVRYIDIFNSPILSSSPRDFWSRRWNMVMHNTFHDKVFLKESDKSPIDKKRKATSSFWSSNNGRGLLVFILSGVLHEMIVCANSREVTLENTAFFLVHGVVVMLEANLLRKQPPAHWLTWTLCVLAHLVFISLTARLFLAPFIRYDFLSPLLATHTFLV
ncbi:hypothetical protein DM01DRAFT_1327425 [Hesseltinella vesiculosa]|uniref:Wax synthase domain-containing protein n=1 Tax=Hesseltinella vesiculosa TaxID=101127 RepID=A0A1X2G7H9_9FUNG|nr:hypothetical protein DM01DRAFT_1327425 [Hesseltinella vesiculosa]